MKDRIKGLVEVYYEDVVAYRQYLHQHPELSFQETKTAEYIARHLKNAGLSVETGVAGTGLLVRLKGKNPESKTVALRADMDALPILEENEVPYKSQNPGVMHACGHDVHTACLMGACLILREICDEFEGTILFIFQPGEEKLPGGASLIIESGVLENPKPVSIFGQHVYNPLPAGTVGVRSGQYMASADELYMSVSGKGGHAAIPQDCIDPILVAAQILVSLQQVVSRHANPTIPTVLSFGKINSVGGATNIIPDVVLLEGTFRTMNEEWRAQAHDLMHETAEGIAKSLGGVCQLEIKKGYPVLENDAHLVSRTRVWMEEYLSREKVVDLPIRLTAEDFAFYSQIIPACFYRLGTGNAVRGITSAVHTPTFDVDEAALGTGMGLLAWLAVQELAHPL